MQHSGVVEFEGERSSDRQGGIGARVVGDHDPPRVRQLIGEELVQAADKAMYQVKDSGKNGIQAAIAPADS